MTDEIKPDATEIKTKWINVPSIVAMALISAVSTGFNKCSTNTEDYKALSVKIDGIKEDISKIKDQERDTLAKVNSDNQALNNDVQLLKLKMETKK